MAKDEAIRNQKVFVRLDNLVEVLNELNRTKQAMNEASAADEKARFMNRRDRVQTINWVLDTLQLPREGN